jgi:CRISPR-associated endoribonuclease Cas6
MRILLKLRSLKDCSYDLKYFHKMQGFFYGLMEDTPYNALHDKPGYKFFCFSNLFPVGDPPQIIRKGEFRSLLFSSPDSALIKLMAAKLAEMRERNQDVHIGEYQFAIEDLRTLTPQFHRDFRIAAATPIIIRIPPSRYAEYNVPEGLRKHSYVFWRPEIDFSAFVKQLEENLFKKYAEFHKDEAAFPERFPVFEQWRFKKQSCVNIIEAGKERPEVGSVWEFSFTTLSADQRKLLEFGLECGFGERNPLGFGFVNIMKHQ